MSLVAVRGVRYNVECRGQGPTVLFLHGFTGSAAGWAPVLEALPEGLRTVCVDLLGHGLSDAPHDPGRYALTEAALDIAELAERLALAPLHLVGYSLGGRLALHVALARPDILTSLVLVSASPGIADAADRAQRKASDAEWARFILTRGVPAFVARWESLPLFATERELSPAERAAVRAERLSQRPHGLANSLLGAGAGAQEYLLERLGGVRVPTLVVAGARDVKYVALAERLGAALPRARVEIVPGAGHAVHRERPAALARLVTQHLRDVEAVDCNGH